MDIRLIRWDASLKGDLVRICNGTDRAYLTNRVPDPYMEADADQWLEMVSKHDGVDGLYRAILADGQAVGNITIEQKSDVQCRDAELGYLLVKEKWRQGIMTEAARQICALAFDMLDIVRITSAVYSPNIASQRVLEKNGFVREGCQKKAIWKNGRLYDQYLYGLLKPGIE